MSAETRAHTALHVLKGAVKNVLGAKWTAGVYVKGSHGRLTVQLDNKPTQEEIRKVEKLANDVIKEDLQVEEIELERSAAETRWGDAIYDLFPVPENITRLRIVNIPGWNVNACNKNHTKKTGEIGSLKISKTRFRTMKRLLEISYNIYPSQ